ncbi:hypothetical protein BDB01DRAFT_729550 [Pilobolus umbonatus]|nr:hypothetical protein BDB01DRAFT_729550 [Pilobolus umbonatus]
MKKFTSSINSPIPTSLAGECKKAANILNQFIDAGQGVDKIIPENILEKAQGLAIYTVLKAGFLFSGRAGSGLVVARLVCAFCHWNRWYWCWWPDWKESKCLYYLGIDYSMITVAAGPLGRNAEASGTASLKHIAAIYSYSKTRGLFAGVSLEGSIVVTRSDANEKFYERKVTAKELLSGTVPPPPEADILYRALNAKFHTLGSQTYSRSGESDTSVSRSNTFKNSHISAPGTLKQPPPIRQIGYGAPTPTNNYGHQENTSSIPPPSYQPNAGNTFNNNNNNFNRDTKPSAPYSSAISSSNGIARRPPPPPPARKPADTLAKALYAFEGLQAGDLSFREGEVITVTKKTMSQDDWWTGKIGTKEGAFPANYVQLM